MLIKSMLLIPCILQLSNSQSALQRVYLPCKQVFTVNTHVCMCFIWKYTYIHASKNVWRVQGDQSKTQLTVQECHLLDLVFSASKTFIIIIDIAC